MDPLTAALNLAASITTIIAKMLDGATPDQKAQLIQFMIDDQKWWRDFFSKFQIKP